MASSSVGRSLSGFDESLLAISTSLSWGHDFCDASASLRRSALAGGIIPLVPDGRVRGRELLRFTRLEPERRQLLVLLAEAWRCLLVERASGRTRTLCLVGSDSDVDAACEVIAATVRGSERCWSEYRRQELLDLISLDGITEAEARADMAAHALEERQGFMERLVDGLDLAYSYQRLNDDLVRSSFDVPESVRDCVASLAMSAPVR